jgi:hypothetical protein
LEIDRGLNAQSRPPPEQGCLAAEMWVSEDKSHAIFGVDFLAFAPKLR